MPEDYVHNGHKYRIPSDADIADAHEAFKVFADSMPSLVPPVSASAPDAPVLATNLTWTAPPDHGSPILAYEIDHDPSITATQSKAAYAGAVCKKDAAHTIDYTALTITPATSMKVTGTTPFTDYTFKVRAINGFGPGPWSNEITTQFNFNEATGGTVSDVTDYNGTGQTWRVHTFTSNDTLTVTAAIKPFNVLLVGGGGSGGHGGWYGAPGTPKMGGGGGHGGACNSKQINLTAAPLAVTVAGAGGTSTFAGETAGGGGGGGNGTDAHGSPSSPQMFNITGTNSSYAQGGRHGNQWPNGNGANGAGPGGGGGGGQWADNSAEEKPGNAGNSGVVIVAYQIA